MTRDPLVSVLVVNHDGGATIEAALASVGGGSDPRIEVIVADNASQDGSLELVHERFPRAVTLALDANLGFGAATNRAAARARGELLLLLNDDARLCDGALDALRARLLADERCAAVAPRLEHPDGRRQFEWVPGTGLLGEALQSVRNRFARSRLVHDGLRRVGHGWLGLGWLTAACLLVRRAAFHSVGGFDEAFFLYFEDSDLCRRLKQAGWRLALEPSARVVHAGGSAPLAGEVEVAYRQSQVHFYAKHRPAWERRLLRWHLRRKYRAAARPDAARLRELLGLGDRGRKE